MEKIKKTKTIEYDVYVTSDGKEFEREYWAKSHEESLRKLKNEEDNPTRFSVRFGDKIYTETGNWIEAKEKCFHLNNTNLVNDLIFYIKNTITEREFRDGKWDMSDWPKNERGHFVCTKEKPMELELAKEGRWEHDDIHETDYDSDYSIEWICNSCRHTWRTEMPD